MERDDIKRPRREGIPLELAEADGVNKELVNFVRTAPAGVLETILTNTEELTPWEIIILASCVLLWYKKRSDVRAESMKTRVWATILEKRFNLPINYYYTHMQRDMPNAMHAFLAYAYSRNVVDPGEGNRPNSAHMNIEINDFAAQPLLRPFRVWIMLYLDGTLMLTFSYFFKLAQDSEVSSYNESMLFRDSVVRFTSPKSRWNMQETGPFQFAYTAPPLDSKEKALNAAARAVYALLGAGYYFTAYEQHHPRPSQRNDVWHTKSCIGCNAATAVSVCAGCNAAAYCSRQCQAAHWVDGGHREACSGGAVASRKAAGYGC